MARDRKRAKQRAQRRGASRPAGGGSGSERGSQGGERGSQGSERGSQLTRADLPGSLEHVGDVDEFDAALVRGADGVPMAGVPAEDLAEEPPALGAGEEPLGAGEEPISAGNGKGNGITSAPVRAPARPARSDQALPKRAIAFLRASWAELQRVQWPNRAQVTQATAVVLGFVAVAGVYFGVADYVAKAIVEAVL